VGPSKKRVISEKSIESAVCAYATRKYDCICYKFVSPARRSVPDRMIVGPGGRLIFIEFKSSVGKTTSGQDREQKRLTDRGQRVYIVNDTDQGKRLIHAEFI